MTEEGPKPTGFLVTPKVISTLVGIVTLLGVTFGASSVVNGYAFRLDKLESDNVELSSSIGQLTNKIDELNIKIVELTFALNNVKDRAELRK